MSTTPWQARVDADGVELAGDLVLPEGARGVVSFAHGSGSSRHSPRNRAVAEVLLRAGLGTLLIDLLTAEEERTAPHSTEPRFDIPLLGRRMRAAVDWLGGQEAVRGLPVGLFGARECLQRSVVRP